MVGEVADVKEDSPYTPDKEQYYQPLALYEKSLGTLASTSNLNGNGGYMAIRTAFPPDQIRNLVRATVQSIDPQLALNPVQTMVQALSGSEARAVSTPFLFPPLL